MNTTRRDFIRIGTTALGGVAFAASGTVPPAEGPMVISTWNFGLQANEAAWKILSAGGRALDAIEAGARVPESDPTNTTVGLGGAPDREGHVTLDACIMDEKGGCGSVVFLEDIEHPISVARMVMEKTPHVMLAGEGARQFAGERFSQTEVAYPAI